ncbi:MAG: VWA domain-containing protein [bacterium]|nr:VWA domain-containing protein [bacterium]
MAKNDYSSEVAENYDQKCLCVMVLDVSGSMGGNPIQELNKGLQDFYDEISNEPTTSQRLEVALVTFSHIVTTIQSPALVENFTMPNLIASGSTATVDAVREAIDIVAARKAWYKTTNQNYYRPWIILMTDGEPNSDQDIEGLAQQIKYDTAHKSYIFLPIGVGNDANMGILSKIQGSIPPMKLKGTKFSSFFKWLSASMGTVVGGTEGQQVNLSAGAGSWMDSFEI